jgi:hydrogenase nickel incorporation protein HypA/HybF
VVTIHEYAVTRGLINIIRDEAEKANAVKITEIKLVIGDLSTIIDESVQMYFDIMALGTVAEGAKLIFRRVPAEFWCAACKKAFIKPNIGFNCPYCGEIGTATGKGKEFYIESMEAE